MRGAANLITAENARAGDDAWWATPARKRALEGFSTQVSVVPGGRLDLCVSGRPWRRYRVNVFRLGWYDGLGARRMYRSPSNVALSREAPEPDARAGYARCDWPVTDVIQIDEAWPSGLYVAQLEIIGSDRDGQVAYVPFVVRPHPDALPDVLVQIPVNTWQAYNNWGGKSLYRSSSTDAVAAVKVSFDRPVPPLPEANLNARAPFVYEVALVRWLEREGYSVGYQTNVDSHRHPGSLVAPRVVVAACHDEYWTKEMRDGFEQAQAAGVHMMFLGANICYWQARYEDDERTLVVYRSVATDPEQDAARKTVKWREHPLRRPERELIGIQYEDGLGSPSRPGDFFATADAVSDPWTAGAGWERGTPMAAIVGYEWDTLTEEWTPPGLVHLLSTRGLTPRADSVRWRAASGAQVFAAGSLSFVHALDGWRHPERVDERVQAFLRNALDGMLAAG